MSRQCLSKWKKRHDALGETGLLDRSSAPGASPAQTEGAVVARIEALRRDKTWSARLTAAELGEDGITISAATVGRWLVRLGTSGAGTWPRRRERPVLRGRSPPATPGT